MRKVDGNFGRDGLMGRVKVREVDGRGIGDRLGLSLGRKVGRMVRGVGPWGRWGGFIGW